MPSGGPASPAPFGQLKGSAGRHYPTTMTLRGAEEELKAGRVTRPKPEVPAR